MRIYLAYKFKGADSNLLRKKLEELSKVLEEQGHETFIFFRDVQKWGEVKTTVQEIVNGAIQGIKDCDMILADISEKANGVYFEIGYAKALGKKVVVMLQADKEANFLKASADEVIEYSDFEDLKEKLKKI